eukprot:evm.model.scf_1801.1 EVM.evm.TU.scf_1801.1   scf_1801:1946-4804(+)
MKCQGGSPSNKSPSTPSSFEESEACPTTPPATARTRSAGRLQEGRGRSRADEVISPPPLEKPSSRFPGVHRDHVYRRSQGTDRRGKFPQRTLLVGTRRRGRMPRTQHQARFAELQPREVPGDGAPSAPPEMADTAMSPPRCPIPSMHPTGPGNESPSAPPISALLQPTQASVGSDGHDLGEHVAAARVAQQKRRNRRNKDMTRRRGGVMRPRVSREAAPEGLLEARRLSNELQQSLIEEDARLQEEAGSRTPSPVRQGFEQHLQSSSATPVLAARSGSPGGGLSESPSRPRSGLSFNQDQASLSFNQDASLSLSYLLGAQDPASGPISANVQPGGDQPSSQQGLSLTLSHMLGEEHFEVGAAGGDIGMSPGRDPMPRDASPHSGVADREGSGARPSASEGLVSVQHSTGSDNQRPSQHVGNGEGTDCSQRLQSVAGGSVGPVDFLQKQMESMRGREVDATMLNDLQSKIDSMKASGDPRWELVSGVSQVFVAEVSDALSLAKKESDRLKQELDNEVLCQICFERKRDVVILPCMHFNFCKQCLMESFKSGSRKCPMCREPVTGELNIK